MGQGEYTIHEFALRLSNLEERHAKELRQLVEVFSNSRVDLPAKRLEDIGKTRAKISRHLKKSIDGKKSDAINLWKICNIYSACAVDVDEAMREIRSALRKRLKKEQNGVKPEGNAIRRLVDEYRPANRRQTQTIEPMEIYDQHKPSIKEQRRWRDIILGRREEKKEERGPSQESEKHNNRTDRRADSDTETSNTKNNNSHNGHNKQASDVPHRTLPPISKKPMLPSKSMHELREIEISRPTVLVKEKPKFMKRNDSHAEQEPVIVPIRVEREEVNSHGNGGIHSDRTSNGARTSMQTQTAAAPIGNRRSTDNSMREKIQQEVGNAFEMGKTAYEEKLTTPTTPNPNPVAPPRSNKATWVRVGGESSKDRPAPNTPAPAVVTTPSFTEDIRRKGVVAQKHSIKVSSGSDEERREDEVNHTTRVPITTITNGRILRYESQETPAKPRLHAHIIHTASDEDDMVDRF